MAPVYNELVAEERRQTTKEITGKHMCLILGKHMCQGTGVKGDVRAVQAEEDWKPCLPWPVC